MNENNRHMISRLRWETTFDDKNKAAELQSRISQWSRFNMQQELNSLLDGVLTTGKVWRIDKLEIDLGTVDYSDLEEELAKKIISRMKEALHALQQANTGGYPEEHRLLSPEETMLEAIQSFLVHGVLPWHFSHEQRSVSNMLLEQLSNNRVALTSMLCRIAAKSRQVRRRIAWQVAEPVIIKIIEEVEPAGSKTIITFANDLAAVQQQNTVVQAPSGEFKKNIWYWVLNYLFTAHGSVFNKKQFLKSSIRQMAAHYNISYLELLNMIGEIVLKTNQPLPYSSGFTSLLAVLSVEESTGEVNEIFRQEEGDDEGFHILKGYLQKSNNPLQADEHAGLNILVRKLAGKDPKALWQYLRAVDTDREQVKALAGLLTTSTLEALLRAMQVPFAGILMHEVYSAVKKLPGHDQKAVSQMIRETAFDYILNNNQSLLTAQGFLEQLIGRFNEPGTPAVLPVLEQMILGRLPLSGNGYTGTGLEVKLAAWRLLQQQPATAIEEQIRTILRGLTAKINSPAVLQTCAILAAAYIQVHPAAVIKTLGACTDKGTVKKLVSSFLTDELAAALQPQLRGDSQNLLTNLSRYISSREYKISERLKSILLRHLYREAVKEALTDPGKSTAAFFESLLAALYRQIPASLSDEFEFFILQLAGANSSVHGAITEPVKQRIKAIYTSVQNKGAASIDLLPATNPEIISRQLRKYYLNDTTKVFPAITSDAVLPVISKLLTDPERVYTVLVTQLALKYKSQLCFASKDQLKALLHEIFWLTLSDYNSYRGSSYAFTKTFLRTARHRLPATTPSTQKKKAGIANDNHRLIRAIEQYYHDSSKLVEYEGKMYTIAALAEKMMIDNPKRLLNLVKNTRNKGAGIALLHFAGDFKKMVSVLLSGLDGPACYFAIKMLLLYEQAERIIKDEEAKQLETVFTAYLYQLTTGSLSPFTVYSNLLKEELLHAVNQNKTITGTNKINKRESQVLFRPNRSYWLTEVLNALIKNEDVPGWAAGMSQKNSGTGLLNQLLSHFPYETLGILKKQQLSEVQLQWLARSADTSLFITAAARLNPVHRSQLKMMALFYEALKDKKWGMVPAGTLQAILFRKIIDASVNNKWDMIRPENIWNEIIWELATRHQAAETLLLQEIKENSNGIPPLLLKALAKITFGEDRHKKSEQALAKARVAPVMKKIIEQQAGKNPGEEGITVLNAGLVIISSYVPMLFGRLGICEGNSFINEEVQAEAVHHLQYLVTGSNCTEESFLPLNKIMCGLDITQPVPLEITMTNEAKELSESLINAFIGFWPAIGHTSIEGFRGNWLVRTGLLKELEEKWELTVEKKPYDVLLNKSPFSFSVVKFPWMKKPLHVSWPY